MFTVTDDSGFLGIIEPKRYLSFVDEDWEIQQLLNHFRDHIKNKNMLLWGTGCENTWRVQVRRYISKEIGCREFTAQINVESNVLYLINYESLTMGAQFPDVELPESYMKDLRIDLDNGLYRVRVVQFYNNEAGCYINRDDVNFLIELEKDENYVENSINIPWCQVGV